MSEPLTREKWIEYNERMSQILRSVIRNEIESFERGTGLKVAALKTVNTLHGREIALEVQL